MNRRTFISMSSAATAGTLLWSPSPSNGQKLELQKMSFQSLYPFPEFDVFHIPFSYAGSYLTLSKQENSSFSKININTVRRRAIPYKWQESWANNLGEISMICNGEDVPYSTIATPWSLTLKAGDCIIQIAFYNEDSLLIDTQNCGLYLKLPRNFSWHYHPQASSSELYDGVSIHYFYFKSYDESLHPVLLKDNHPNTTGDTILFKEQTKNTIFIRIGLEEDRFVPLQKSFEEVVAGNKVIIDNWMKHVPKVKKKHLNAAKAGWYLFWNLQVSPEYNYSHTTVLSSKKSMDMIWSWDNCFNALALVKAYPALAWEQLFIILDKQLKNGLLPDAVNDLLSTYGFNKPPIWGLTIKKLLKYTPRKDWNKYLEKIYFKVAKFTQWWFNYRNLDHTFICEYVSGNDSGWDNATIFDEHLPVASPDLTTYLILQAEELSWMAKYLGKAEEAGYWKKIALQQTSLFHKTFVHNNELIYLVKTSKGMEVRSSTSLITRLPVLLGDKLSMGVRNHLIQELSREDIFLCPGGVASEALNSNKYESNGYWRGPVWGPSTYLIVEGLIRCGEESLAKKIAQRYCDMVSHNVAFRENYDAVTGKGQYDSGMTWCSADFLLLAEWLAENEKE